MASAGTDRRTGRGYCLSCSELQKFIRSASVRNCDLPQFNELIAILSKSAAQTVTHKKMLRHPHEKALEMSLCKTRKREAQSLSVDDHAEFNHQQAGKGLPMTGRKLPSVVVWYPTPD